MGNERLVEQIRQRMEEKNTEELLAIWQKNDTKEWSNEAFEAIRQVLSARGESLPQQMQTEANKDIISEEHNFDVCEKCKIKAKGNRYTFHYGKSADKRTEGMGSGIRIFQLYSDIKSESIYLCDKCVRGASRLTNIILSIFLLGLTALTSLFLGGMIYVKINGDDTVPTCLLPVLGIFALSFLVGAIVSINKVKTGSFEQISGERMAISIRNIGLRSTGYDTFWTTEAVKNLSRDISPK